MALSEWCCVSKDVVEGWSDRKGSDLDIHWQLNTSYRQIVAILPLRPPAQWRRQVEVSTHAISGPASVVHAHNREERGSRFSLFSRRLLQNNPEVPGHTTLVFWSHCSWLRDKLLIESGLDITQATYFQVSTCCAAHFLENTWALCEKASLDTG